MLAADKLLLASNYKRGAIRLKDKELRLHYDNFTAISTQAAVLIGFAVAAVIELEVPPECPWLLQLLFHLCTMVSLVANFQCIAYTTQVSVLATSLSLRGPDGSVHDATEGMFKERNSIIRLFVLGLVSLHFAAMFASMIKMTTSAATVSVLIILGSMYHLVTFGRKVFKEFSYDEQETETLDEVLLGPAMGRFLSKRKLREQKSLSCDNLRQHLEPAIEV